MCGIAGFITALPSTDGKSIARRMTAAIEHRGPDGSGFFTDDHAALGHRRLSIIDVAAGHQPMTNEDERLWIIYNGEIFNHAQVRPELERAGHRYQTRCDTETIIHAYEQYGADSVTKFRGMFSFAIWDRDRKKLFCARDRLGIKPFYYYADRETFVFGSEIKALLEHPAVPRQLEESVLAEYLTFGYVSEERTMFRGIRKLMPGHTVEVSMPDGRIQLDFKQYWDIPAYSEGSAQRDDREWIEECRRRVEETVEMRLMSDVPLGMFLSGGIDSSTIAALMKRLVSTPVKTFSVGYAEAEYSELGYARDLAARIGSDHHEVTVSMSDFFEALPSLIWHEDEPITWPSSVSLYFVSRLASQQVKVVLTGEGADELFAGYSRYGRYAWNQRWLERYRIVPEPVRSGIRSWIESSSMLSATLRRKLGHTFLGRAESIESLYLDNFYSAFSRSEEKDLGYKAAANDACYGNFLRYYNAHASDPVLSRLLYADQKSYLVELLMKQDQMSMACSIESRVPFLDHHFVEFAARTPAHLKIQGASGKHILKQAVADLIPEEVITRKKMGFPTPIRGWLLSEQAAPLFDSLLDPKGLIASYLDLNAVRNLIEVQRNGTQDATDRLWRLLNLQLWGQVVLEGGREHWRERLLAVGAVHSA